MRELEDRSFESALGDPRSRWDLPQVNKTREQVPLDLSQSTVHWKPQGEGERRICQKAGLNTVSPGDTDTAKGRLKERVSQKAELDGFAKFETSLEESSLTLWLAILVIRVVDVGSAGCRPNLPNCLVVVWGRVD